MSFQYFIISKPYGMLSQFTPEDGHAGLGDLYKFPKDVYPVGRLDTDSEGLLLLTNDKKLNHLLLDPKHAHQRAYLAQLDGAITDEALERLVRGVHIRVNDKDHLAKAVKAEQAGAPENLPERNPPIRYRKSIPTSWIKLVLTEGKNRQVRKMTAAAGFPTLRLIRIGIEDIQIGDMKPGDVLELQKDTVYKKLKIKPDGK
ncbi:MAG TPA: pseudouridine synthase [Bacteroidia bacterium]